MKRHPRFQNLNKNMPDHLKVSSRKDQKGNSMPPKIRIPNHESGNIDRLNQTVNYDQLAPKPLKIDIELEKEIKAKQRTGSTGGSSMKDSEIIKVQYKNISGSPFQSPIGNPKFPILKAPALKQVLAAGRPVMVMPNSSSRKAQKILNKEGTNKY